MNERQRRALDQLRADQAVIRAAGDMLRDPEVRARWAGLSEASTAGPLAGLLHAVADALSRMDGPTRRHVVQVARDLTGDRMERPTVHRSRRR